MARVIKFIRLDLKNFAGLPSASVTYSDVTRLEGQNGEGKTTIGTAPVWTLYGTDIYGNKYNPTPTTYEFDNMVSTLFLSVDGSELELTREINEKGVNLFYVNTVPVKAKEFEAAVNELFDKEMFLSLYNPSYFFTQHWSKQREQILRHTTPPARSEVLTEMSRTSPEQKKKDIALNPAASKLDELLKKHSLDDLQKIHGGTGGQKSKLEKQHIADQSRTKTLQEQLDKLPVISPSENVGGLQSESEQLAQQIKEIQESIESAKKVNEKHASVKSGHNTTMQQVKDARDRYMKVFNEPIEDTCPTCQRALDEESVKAVTDTKEKRKEELRKEHADLVDKRKALEVELAAIEVVDVSEKWEQIRSLEQRSDELQDIINAQSNRDKLQKDIQTAKETEISTLASLKDSIFILDAIKAYKAKEAELQAEKVQSLFTTLQIRLFKYVKTKDEYEPDFSIQMNGKDYATLSTGEKIKAGLELTEVLFKQSELITPTFIDGIGEYTSKVAVYGQLITARAIEDKTLDIKTINHKSEE
jgi:hypothetical protein